MESIVLKLSTSPIVQSFKIIKQREGEDEGFIRAKSYLYNSDIFEFSEYFIVEKNLVVIKTYNFHWQKSDGTLIKRWDNVEHHQEVVTFPYHLHHGKDQICESEPMNFEKVLQIIENELVLKDENEVF